MILYYHLITLTLLLFSCGSVTHEKNENILGSWAGCSSSQYTEISFLEDLYYIFYPYDSVGTRRRYRYEGDTVYVYEYEKGDEIQVQFGVELRSDSLILRIANDEPIYLHSLNTDSFNPKEMEKYYSEFEQRHRESNCYKSYENHFEDIKIDTFRIDDDFENLDFDE